MLITHAYILITFLSQLSEDCLTQSDSRQESGYARLVLVLFTTVPPIYNSPSDVECYGANVVEMAWELGQVSVYSVVLVNYKCNCVPLGL